MVELPTLVISVNKQMNMAHELQNNSVPLFNWLFTWIFIRRWNLPPIKLTSSGGKQTIYSFRIREFRGHSALYLNSIDRPDAWAISNYTMKTRTNKKSVDLLEEEEWNNMQIQYKAE